MTYTLIPNIWYTITPETDCDLATPNGISIHLPAGIQYFHYADCVSIDITGTATVTQNPPLFKPASASALGGGYIESNLHIGHGASAAVAAQCTLTLGNLATGGTLEDSNGHHVELEDPHKYAEGSAAFRDAAEACTLTIGEWSREWTEKKDAKAYGTFSLMGDEDAIAFTNGGDEYSVLVPANYATSVDDWNAAFTAAGCGIVCTAVEAHGEVEVSVEAAEIGEAGNGFVISVENYEPVTLDGGSTARTAADVFRDIHEDPDCPVDVTLDADEMGLGFTAREYGVNDAISAEGDMFSNWSGMSGGHGDYTVAELVTAISGEFDDIEPTAGEAEGTITLTANDAGADANAITYTSTGCFGGGTVKQGSTTRGKNAVEQTAFKIYLNGDEFSSGSVTVDPAPTQGSPNAVSSGGVYAALRELPAPVPTALTPNTVMKHGGVYTVAADGTELNFSEAGLATNATAEIVVTTGDGVSAVTWPGWVWCTEDGLPPKLDYFQVSRVSVQDDGARTAARVLHSYNTVKEWLYKSKTSDTQTSGDIVFVQGETHVFSNGAQGYKWFIREYTEKSHALIGPNTIDGTEWEPDVIRGDTAFNRACTFVLPTAKKFSYIAFGGVYRYGGKFAVMLQAWDDVQGEWVDATGVISHPATDAQGALTRFVAPVRPEAPAASKWRILGQSTAENRGPILRNIRFFE